MTCTLKEAELEAYLFEEISLEKKTIIEAHLQSCAACNSKIFELNIFNAAWDNPDTSLVLPDTFVDNIMSQLPTKKRRIDTLYSLKNSSIFNLVISSAAAFILLYTGVFGNALSLLEIIPDAFADTASQFYNVTGQGIAWLNTLSYHLSQFFRLSI